MSGLDISSNGHSGPEMVAAILLTMGKAEAENVLLAPASAVGVIRPNS